MGNETIFYYVAKDPVTGSPAPFKKHFWQKVRPESFIVEKEELTIVTFLLPTPRKGWKKDRLLAVMQESMKGHPLYDRGVIILMQKEIEALFTGQCTAKTEADGGMEEDRKEDVSEGFLSFGFSIAEKILRERFPLPDGLQSKKAGPAGPESIVLMLGTHFFTEEQMRHFLELISPYLSGVNDLTILYEAENEEEVIHEYTEELYYEYGLVSQLLCGEDTPVLRPARLSGQRPALFLDYGYSGVCPFRMPKEEGYYLDLASSEEKEALFRRKYRGIFYQSPRKYLDTAVKSGYDK